MVIEMHPGRSGPDEATLDLSEKIRRYARGELAGDELEAFELALFEDSELLEQVEAEFLLQDGLRAAANEKHPGAHAQGSPSAVSPPAAPAFPTPPSPSQTIAPPKRTLRSGWALAASLLLGVGGGALWSPRGGEQPALRQATLVPLTALRGVADSNPAVSAPEGSPLVLRYLARNPLPHRLSIRDRTGRAVHDSGPLMPDAEGWLVLTAPPLPTTGSPYRIALRSGERSDEFQLSVR